MLCPACGNILQKIEVTTDAGGKFQVEHCGICGGTWFDPYEINRISFYEVVRLAGISTTNQNQPSFLYTRLCPRCYLPLKRYKGESVARGVELLRCENCRGIWATQQSLEKFKTYQEKIIKEYKIKNTAFPALSVVFVPAIFVLLLFLSTYITVTNLQKAKEERIQATAEISNLQTVAISPTKVLFTFQTKTPLISKISFETSILDKKEVFISEKPSTDHKLLLTGLKSDTTYQYQIILTDKIERSFKTEKKSFVTLP